MEKIEDEIYDIRPKKFAKKLVEIDETFEKNDMRAEKIENKLNDIVERINKVYEMLKGIGGVENLIDLNKHVQERLDDIKEAQTYFHKAVNFYNDRKQVEALNSFYAAKAQFNIGEINFMECES